MRPDPHAEYYLILADLDVTYGEGGWGAGHFRSLAEARPGMTDDLLKLYRGEEVVDYKWREGESTLDYCKRLPKRRESHLAKGLVLEFPRTGLIGVPFEMSGGSGWNVVVIRADDKGVYPPNGYSLSICRQEIETAIEREIA